MNENYTKRPMWQWVTVYLVVAAILYGGYYVYAASKQPSKASSNNMTATSNTPILKRFQDSQEANFSYQIFPGTLSSQAKEAMAGFNMDAKTLPDGSTQINLTSTNSEYHNQQVVVKPGYTLYFIEKSPGDDSSDSNLDRTVADDTTVLVDPQGFLVQQ